MSVMAMLRQSSLFFRRACNLFVLERLPCEL
jgi:hypothetical protein